MNIDLLTIGELREINALLGKQTQNDQPYKIGANYFLRTVTHHHTGRLVQVTQQELVLEDAAWIAEDGKFSDALKKCEFSEVEMFPKGRVIVGRAAIIDATELTNIPTSTK
jgi:hypothetical protein